MNVIHLRSPQSPLRHLGLLLTAAVWLSSAAPVEAGLLISDHFTRTGPSESVTALFTDMNGETTQNTYSGLVEIIVSGEGQSADTAFNDAFYLTSPIVGVQIDPDLFQLNVGWSDLPYALSGNNNATEFITFIDGVGAVAPPALPAYSGDNHTYHFILDIQDTPSQLTFGVNDGNFRDNFGQYNIEVFQVEAGASQVPEPASLDLLGIGAMTLLGFYRRRSRLPSSGQDARVGIR